MQVATILGIVLVAVLVVFGIVVRSLVMNNDVVSLKLELTRQRLNITESQLSITQTLYQMKASEKPSYDETTKKLIVLAIQNTNDNEARNAALTACKRIAREFR